MQPNQDVEEAVITPMTATLPPPTYLRGNPAAIEHSLNVYRRALSRFDRPALEQGWQRAAEQNEYCMWPKVADLVRACEAFQPRKSIEQDGWVEQANDEAYRYSKRFVQTSQAGMRAREGGYERELREYVFAAAWVQSQMVHGRCGVGYDSNVLFGHFSDQDERRKAMDEFFEKAREQALKGHIRVHVPAEVIERCKERVEKVGRGR